MGDTWPTRLKSWSKGRPERDKIAIEKIVLRGFPVGLEFVNPALLLGIAAAAVPIVLHLIMRQQPRWLEFPALRFVRQKQEANRRRLRLRHLILLALRVGAFCLLASALARPSLKTSGGSIDQEAPVAAALIFDTSPRMAYRDQNQTRIQVAQELGRWLLAELPEESQVAVLESRLGAAMFQVDRGAAKDRIDRLETTSLPQPLVSVLMEAAELLEKCELLQKEIYIFTDLAQPSWASQNAGRLQERLKKLDSLGMHVVDVGVLEPKNFALGDVRLPAGQVLAKNSPLNVEVDLVHRGGGGSRMVDLFLASGNSPRGSQTAELKDGQSQTLEFRLGGLETGTHQGWLRIQGEDGLAFDDVRYFTVDVQPPWPALILAPSPAEDYAFFLRLVLAPDVFQLNDQARYKADVVMLDGLAKLDLAKYSAVFVLDPTPLAPESWQKLRDYAAGGGGLAIFLGRNAEAVDAFNQQSAQELLPGRLSQQARRLGGELFLSPDNYNHPLLAKFKAGSGGAPWEGYPVFRYWQLEGLAEGVGTIVPYSDGRPAILERPIGQGRVVVMTTPISDWANSSNPWNFLPTGTVEFEPWPFVMLMDGMASYLVGSTDGQLNYYAGQTAVLRLDPNQRFTTYRLSVPARHTEDPAAPDESLRRSVDLKQQAIVESSTERPGNYRVQAGGEDGLNRGFSVNLPTEASDLTRIDQDQLKKIFGEVKFRTARSREQIVRDIGENRVGRELFPLLILLVAIVLGAEHILANRFYRR